MSLKKLLERDVRVWLPQSAKDALQLRQPRIGAAERGSVHDPAIPGRVDRDVARRREAAKEDRGFAMNELGAQLDRERSESLDIGQDATAWCSRASRTVTCWPLDASSTRRRDRRRPHR